MVIKQKKTFLKQTKPLIRLSYNILRHFYSKQKLRETTFDL